MYDFVLSQRLDLLSLIGSFQYFLNWRINLVSNFGIGPELLIGMQSTALFAQCAVAIATFAVIFQAGIMVGWSSPNIARLTRENSTIPLTLSQASWVVSCMNLGRFASVIMVPVLIELVGSKKTVSCSLLPTAASWILILIADSAEWLYVARFLGGITYGIVYACFSMFLGEVAATDYRGTLIFVAMNGAPLGTIFGTVAETYLPMGVSSWIYLAMSLATMLLFAWLPDSPFNLVKSKKLDEARRSLVCYRGEAGADKELQAVVSFIEANSNQNFSRKMRQLRSAPTLKCIALVVTLFSLQQLCGFFSVVFYMEIILTKAQSFWIEPREAVVYANAVSVGASLVSVCLIDRLGRRVLLLISAIGMAAAMTMLGLHFHLVYSLGFVAANMPWLPLIAVVLVRVTYSVGLLSVPSVVLGEVFPTSIKSTAACVISFTSAFLAFVSSKSYQPMVDALGEAYVFWIYAGISILTVPVALFWLPETKGKSLQEIQDSL